MKQWYGDIPKGHQDFSHALHSAHKGKDSALQDIYSVLMSGAPDIAKATIVPNLGDYPSRQTYTTSVQMLGSNDPMIRISALQSLQSFPPRYVVKEVLKALEDPIRSVRIEAARIMMQYDRSTLTRDEQENYVKALGEYKASLDFLSDRAETQTVLAGYYTNIEEMDKAEKAYEEAMRIQKFYVPAYVNYANFLQDQGKEKESFDIINKGLSHVKDSGVLLESLGLWYIRNNQKDKGIEVLEKASALDKTNAHLQYVYAVAIAEKDTAKAIKILEESLKYHSGDAATLSALVYYYSQMGNTQMERLYKQKLDNTFQINMP
jgi:tetratricopeptide (TPR) repeat protein